MKTCDKHYLVVDYFFDELSDKQGNEFETHLPGCENCRNHLNAFIETVPMIKQQKRILPEKELINKYYSNLKTTYYKPKKFSDRIKNLFDSLIFKPTLPIRLAEAAVLILIGVFIGREIIWKSQPAAIQQFANGATNINSYINELILTNFLQETEMIFLDVANINSNDDDQAILNISQLAQYGNLLEKTSLCRGRAEATEDEKLINLIDDIELILLELCNLEKKLLQEKMSEIREQIHESNLLFEIANFTEKKI